MSNLAIEKQMQASFFVVFFFSFKMTASVLQREYLDYLSHSIYCMCMHVSVTLLTSTQIQKLPLLEQITGCYQVQREDKAITEFL